MESDALDNIDATIAELRRLQDDEQTSPEAAEAARLAEVALLQLLDTLLAEAMRVLIHIRKRKWRRFPVGG